MFVEIVIIVIFLFMMIILMAEIVMRTLSNLNKELELMELKHEEDRAVEIWISMKELIYVNRFDLKLLLRGIYILFKLSVTIALKEMPRIIMIKILMKEIQRKEMEYARQREKRNKSKAR